MTEKVHVGMIGAGNFSSSVLLPILYKHPASKLIEVVTTSGLTSANAARKFGFERTSSDFRSVLEADDIHAVVVATRHSTHSHITAEAIRSGKAVFVEKPLAIDLNGFYLVRQAITESGNHRLLVGFNRRFSPMIGKIRQFFSPMPNPLMMLYRVHAGQMDSSSWYRDPLEGSRFVGEAGHFLDVFSYLTNSRPVSVYAKSLRPLNTTRDDLDNLSVVVTFEDGSVGNLFYLTQGANKVPKEYLEIFGGGRTAVLHNFHALDLMEGNKQHSFKSGMDKGHSTELNSFIQAVNTGGEMPIAVDSLLDTTLVTLGAIDSLRSGEVVQLVDFLTQAVVHADDVENHRT